MVESCGSPPIPPTQCITDSLRRRGYNSSQDLPSLVLDFVKLHPLMARPVVPTRGRPLLLKRNVRYTQLTGTHVSTPAGPTYDLLFLGTGAPDPNPRPLMALVTETSEPSSSCHVGLERPVS